MSYSNKFLSSCDPHLWSTRLTSESKQTLPIVTVGILSHNRKNDLRGTLDAIVLGTDYPHIEIIVVDNDSSDGSSEMVATEFPTAVLIRLSKNIGTAARNHIFDAAKGKYIFMFDDDSFPATPATIYRIVEIMESDLSITALNTNIFQPRSNVHEQKGWDLFSTFEDSSQLYVGIYIVEGGVCIRRSSIGEIRYDHVDLWGAEGMDLSLQFFRNNLKMALHPFYTTLHWKSTFGIPRKHDSSRKAESVIKLFAKHFGAPLFYVLSTLYIVRRIIGFIIRPRSAIGSIRGLVKGLRAAKNYTQTKPTFTISEIGRMWNWFLFVLRW